MSPIHRLSGLQKRTLKLLSGMEPKWTLVGGAALAAIHLKHRETRDLDLFWREAVDLNEVLSGVKERLDRDNLRVATIQQSPGFVRLKVSDDGESIIVDLIKDTTPPVRADEEAKIDDFSIRIAARHEILVNKLCALLGRSELRDLLDVKALLESGESLKESIKEAPLQDEGFSPLTFAWVLKSMDLERLSGVSGFTPLETDELSQFRDALVDQVLEMTKPQS